MRAAFLIVLMLYAATVVCAVPSDSSAVAEHHRLLLPGAACVSGNPAVVATAFTHRYSEMSVSGGGQHADEPLFYQLGSGRKTSKLHAYSFLPLDSLNRLWGEASYERSKRYSTRWISTADYMLLYPHVMADTAGGDLDGERYAFEAAAAHRLHNLTLGIEAAFRAEHEFRTIDPRPRNIVADLVVRGGLLWRAPLLSMGISGSIRIYKQSNDVTFYKESGSIPELQMTGLGTDYKRFAGGASQTHYKGVGWSIGTDWRTVGRVYLSTLYSYQPYRKMLTKLNATPITTLFVRNAEATGGYALRHGALSWSPYVIFSFEKRRGDEEIAGNASVSEYATIGTLTMYNADAHYISIGLRGTIKSTSGRWECDMRGGSAKHRQRYEYPLRQMESRRRNASLHSAWSRTVRQKDIIMAHIGFDIDTGVKESLRLPVTTDAAATDLVLHTYRSMTADYRSGTIGLRYHWHLPYKSINGIFATADGNITRSKNYNNNGWHIALGINF